MRRMLAGAFGLAALSVSGLGAAPSPPPPPAPVPRSVLFGNPVREFPSLSPDGARLAFLAPDNQGVQQVWVGDANGPIENAKPVTRDPHRPVQIYRWAGDGRHVLYEQDSDGDENYHVYSADLGTGLVRDLTPFQGARAQNLLVSLRHPDEILVGLNLRRRDLFDVYRVDLATGALRLDTENPGDVLSWTTDSDFRIRAATAFDPKTTETIVRVRDSAASPWRDLLHIPFEDGTMFGQVNGGSVVAGFSADGRSLAVVTALHGPTQRLERIDAATGRTLAVLAEDPRADITDDPLASPDFLPLVLTHPVTGEVQAVAFEYGRAEWKFVDPSVEGDFALLASKIGGFLEVCSRTLDDRAWVVMRLPGSGPLSFYLFDRHRKEVRPLFEDQPALDKYTLARPEFVTYRSRDGLTIPAYLTLPPGEKASGLPFVLLPHGGPWMRDHLGYDPLVQWLATRGCAVLQPQFRGSLGFGKKFLNAGNHEFGLKMEDDILDGARWAVEKGLADPKRLGILGGSAGGYAVLRAITEHPDMFAAAVDLVGPSDLKLLFSTMPAGWGAVKARWVRRIGDVEHDEALDRRLSPLFHVEKIRTPLLIGQGANDPRVNIKNSDLVVAELRKRNIPVTYVVYPDEGHGFARPENNLDFFGRAEEFLARYLGCRAEPWTKVEGATAEVR